VGWILTEIPDLVPAGRVAALGSVIRPLPTRFGISGQQNRDWNLTRSAAITGAVGGALGPVIQGLGHYPGTALGKTLGGVGSRNAGPFSLTVGAADHGSGGPRLTAWQAQVGLPGPSGRAPRLAAAVHASAVAYEGAAGASRTAP
jgi:hypothetical protein